ncbi:MAG: SusC/RagA family TonB-linked outer membrane protein, partial [Chitinophagales bacterium]
VMNRAQYLQHAANWGVAGGRIDDPQYADLINNDTDWQDEIFQNGIMQSHNLAVSGGSKNSTFRVGAGYIDQEGVLLNTGSDRYSFRANSDFTLGRLKIGENLSVSLVDRTPESTAGGRSAIEHAIKMPPYFAVFNSANVGGYQGVDNSLDAQDAENPVRVLAHPQRSQKRTNLLGNLYAEYEIMDGLKFRVQGGLDYWSFNNNDFTPSFSGEPTAVPFAVIGQGNGTHRQITAFGQLNYLKSFGNHNFDVLLLSERNNSLDTRAGASSTNAITDEIPNLTNIDAQIGSFQFEYTRIGYLGRINYDYDGKYILAGSYRRDASSRFGPSNRWAGFYSVAGGWVVSKESFFPQSGIISSLKLRGSVGTVGNDRIGEYRYAASINTGSYNSSFVDILTGSVYLGSGTTAGNVATPDLRWETTTMTNVGMDMYLWDNRVSFAAEYYRNVSDDLLINVQLTPSLGGHNGNGPRNVGSVEVDGFEFNVGYNNAEGPLKWSVDFNLSTTNNIVQNLNGEVLGNGSFEGSDILRSIEGESLNHFFGFVTDGLFQDIEEILTSPLQEDAQPGDIKFRDISGEAGVPDGVIDDFDKTVIGNPIPDFTYGFSLRANYGNFDASVFINGMQGNEIYNTNIWDLEGGRRFFNAGPQALDAWTPSNRDTDIPRITTDPENLVPSDRFVEDGSFTRLKNVTLGYTFGNIGKQGSTSIRFYVSGQNLVTITDYSGLDPEVGSSSLVGNNSSQVGLDRGNYPLSKTYISGLQIKF